jgi:hypothetical protein
VLTSTYEARPVRASAFLGHVAHLWPTGGPAVARSMYSRAHPDPWACGPDVVCAADELKAECVGTAVYKKTLTYEPTHQLRAMCPARSATDLREGSPRVGEPAQAIEPRAGRYRQRRFGVAQGGPLSANSLPLRWLRACRIGNRSGTLGPRYQLACTVGPTSEDSMTQMDKLARSALTLQAEN